MYWTKMNQPELTMHWELCDLQEWSRCAPCSVQRHGDRWGFNIQTAHRVPLVSLTYETESLAKEALRLMIKVIEGAVVAIHETSAGKDG